MTQAWQHRSLSFRTTPRASALALMLVIAFALSVAVAPTAQAQTLTVIHNFTEGADGSAPAAGVTLDRAGNLYGTTSFGDNGSGTVFKLTRTNSGWIFSPLYAFPGEDRANPQSRVIFGPDGSLYGTTVFGGNGPCNNGAGYACGTVFNLKPPPSACKSALCPWTETILLSFNESDGAFPYGEVAFDQAGNLYSTTSQGGTKGAGTVFMLTPSNGSWTESVLYNFLGGSDGASPMSGVLFDSFGNLYGTTYTQSTVFELTPGTSGWTEKTLFSFSNRSDGCGAYGGLTFDASGNLYGTTTGCGPSGSSGTAFELTPPNGIWTINILAGFPYSDSGEGGSYGDLVRDNAGNLYGTTLIDGAYREGSIFKLTPTDGGWTYTSLHDFTGGDDGGQPFAGVTMDANGNLYGTTYYGGTTGEGIVFELTP